jgi:16S rRNA (guanine527-N7)-methyltransferase
MDAGRPLMAPLKPAAIEAAFRFSQIDALPPKAYEKLAAYLELLERWNTRLNLTSLRSSDEILKRHLVECAFMAQNLPSDVLSLMDYGSGAGLPGLVIAICRPEIEVTLAEAHAKKASFLREVTRSVGLSGEIYGGRVEDMDSARQFHMVSMRAVEKMDYAIPIALRHVEHYLAILTTTPLAAKYRKLFSGLDWRADIDVPNSEQIVLAMAVPRGTER